MNVVLEWVMGSPSAQAGAIDVIAVRKADGTISCSPFHVKLGKSSKKGEKKIVKLKVNGKSVDLSMKLGPAGEAFFVERTREFPRRELASVYPGSPYGDGAGVDSAGPLSPRDETELASPVVTGDQEAALYEPLGTQILTTSSVLIDVPATTIAEITPAESSTIFTGNAIRPTPGSRPRSLSEGDAFTKLTSPELQHIPVPAPISVRVRTEAAATCFPDRADAFGSATHSRRARAASDMSELLVAGQRAIYSSTDGDLAAEATTTTLCPGKEPSVPAPPSEAEPSASAAEDSSVAWMWRWGTLPVKKKPKTSSGDLQALPHAHPAAPTAPADDAVATDRPAEDEGNSRAESSVVAAHSTMRVKDVRGRAVSLPQMFPAGADDGSGTALRRSRGLQFERHALNRGRDMSLQQKVTAVETDIPFSRPAQESAEAQDFALMFELASKDASTFHALSLCGHLLLGLDAEEPRTPAALRHLLHAHLITPKDIVTSGVLGNVDLVVILDDFLLPIAAAERLLAVKKAAPPSIDGDPDNNSSGTAYISHKEVTAVLDELSAKTSQKAATQNGDDEVARAVEDNASILPVWAGRRISLWGQCSSEEAAAEHPESGGSTLGGTTPLGALHWKESFSDLVQAYRVQSISDFHSSGLGGSSSTTDQHSYTVSPLLQELFPPGSLYPGSYRGLWRAQHSASLEVSSFTALIELDGSSLSLQDGAARNVTATSDDALDRDYGVGYSLHPERLSDASSSHHSLPMLLSMEAMHEEQAEGSADALRSAATLAPKSPLSGATYMRDALPPIAEYGGSTTQTSHGEEGDTDGDNLSIQDIDFDDISPEPAGGDFYDSDTDSYLSMSLEDGEPGSAHGTAFRGGDPVSGSAAGSLKAGDTAAGDASGPARRRFRKYRYRKVLVPSQEQLELLDLKDGPNDIVFELEGCTPLKSCLFVWPADAKVVVTDLEGIFSRQQSNRNSGVWISFLGGGSYYASAVSKTEFDACIRLFAALSRQGYRIIYLAQGTQSSATTAAALLSSQEYLAGFKATTGERLPPGPVFRSPDSLVRAFGAARTEVFKASALRGVKSLFPAAHNPYHACFCVREGDAIPFARFGFPEGRIFLVSDKGVIRSANRTCTLSFPKITELLHQIFPQVIDSQTGLSSQQTNPIQAEQSAIGSGPAALSSMVVGSNECATATSSGPKQSAGAPTSTETFTAAAGRAAAVVTVSTTARALRTSTDDTYNDFNFWKIPPAIIEDEY